MSDLKHEPCESCRGPVKPRKVRVDHHWKGVLIVVEKVPVGVCHNCGQRYFDASVLRKLDLMAQGEVGSVRRISVVVADYSLAAAA